MQCSHKGSRHLEHCAMTGLCSWFSLQRWQVSASSTRFPPAIWAASVISLGLPSTRRKACQNLSSNSILAVMRFSRPWAGIPAERRFEASLVQKHALQTVHLRNWHVLQAERPQRVQVKADREEGQRWQRSATWLPLLALLRAVGIALAWGHSIRFSCPRDWSYIIDK